MGFEDAPATFYDGETAGKTAVRLNLSQDQDALLIVYAHNGIPIQSWPLSRLRRTGDSARPSLYLADNPVEARLILERPEDAAALEAFAPNLHKRPPLGRNLQKLVLWSGGAVAAFLLLLFVIVPALSDRFARFIPADQEHQLGRSVVRYLERSLTGAEDLWTCKDPAGVRALETMAASLMEGQDFPYPVTIEVVDHPMINAFAVPGGSVVLMKGLVETAETPDEVAAVLAHELGHVINRDPIRLMMRAAGTAGMLSLVLGDATGGTFVAIVGDQLIRAKYTRTAEAVADDYAIASLERAGSSPAALASFFERLSDKEVDLGPLNLFASHPPLESRAEVARAATGEGAYTPILSDDAWAKLRRICDS